MTDSTSDLFRQRAGVLAQLERFSDLVLALHPDGTIAHAGPRTLAVLGRDLDDLIGAGPAQWLLPAAAADLADALAGDPHRAHVRLWRTGADGYRAFNATLTDMRTDPDVAAIVLTGIDDSSDPQEWGGDDNARVRDELRRGTQIVLSAAVRHDDPQSALEAVCAGLENVLAPEHPTVGVTIIGCDQFRTTHRAAGPALTARMNETTTIPASFARVQQLIHQVEHDKSARLDGRAPIPVMCGPVAAEAAPYTSAWTVALRGTDGLPFGVLKVLFETEQPYPCPVALRALERYVPLAALLISRHLRQVETAQSQAMFRSVFYDTPVPSALVTDDEVFLEVNQALADLLETTREDLIGTPLADLAIPVRDERGVPVRWTTRRGKARWVTRSTAPLRSRVGHPGNRVEQYLDVTDQYVSQEEVRLLNEMLCSRIDELDAAQERLAAAFRKINQVREEERRQLAVGLHDASVQQIIAAMWMLDELDPGEESADIKEVRGVLQEAVDSLRGVIRDLRPPMLDSAPLAASLEQRAVTILEDHVQVQVHDATDGQLDEELKVLIYRNVSEALRNVRKHAEAENVQVVLRERSGAVAVLVLDDGVGFDPQAATERVEAGHYGLMSMREEITLAGGTFAIGARTDGLAGTEVAFALPRLGATLP